MGGGSSAAGGSSVGGGSSSGGTGAITWMGNVTQSVPNNSQVTFISATIPAGTIVTVGAGTVFTGTGKILVSGTLNVEGTAGARVNLASIGVEVQSGGNATIRYADMVTPPVGIGVKAGAGTVLFERVDVDGATTPIDMAGGTLTVDHCNFTADSRQSGSCRINAPNIEIRDSLLRTGNAGSADFLIFGNGGGIYAHHNDFDGEHCAIHINAGSGATRFEYNVFHNNSYTIMKYNTAAMQFKFNDVGLNSSSTDSIDQSMPNAVSDVESNYFEACPATGNWACTTTVNGAGIRP